MRSSAKPDARQRLIDLVTKTHPMDRSCKKSGSLISASVQAAEQRHGTALESN